MYNIQNDFKKRVKLIISGSFFYWNNIIRVTHSGNSFEFSHQLYVTDFPVVNVYVTDFPVVNIYVTDFPVVNVYVTDFPVVNVYVTDFPVVNVHVVATLANEKLLERASDNDLLLCRKSTSNKTCYRQWFDRCIISKMILKSESNWLFPAKTISVEITLSLHKLSSPHYRYIRKMQRGDRLPLTQLCTNKDLYCNW
jgi:hypothetical protein